MQRISGPLWIFAFCLIALLWPLVHHFSEKPRVRTVRVPVVVSTPGPTQSPQDDKLTNFCIDPRHANTPVCIGSAGSAPLQSGVRRNNPVIVDRHGNPVVVRSQKRTTERGSSTTVIRNNSDSAPDPSSDSDNQMDLPIPDTPDLPVDVPDVDIPEVDVPITNSVPDLPVP